MLRYSELGFKVLGVDVDENKVSSLNAGNSYINIFQQKKLISQLRKVLKQPQTSLEQLKLMR